MKTNKYNQLENIQSDIKHNSGILHYYITKTEVTITFVFGLMLMPYLCFPSPKKQLTNTENITLSLSNTPLQTVFKEIEKQTEYVFLYEDKILTTTKPVTVNFKNSPLKIVLDACFINQPINYDIVDRNIIIKLKSSRFEHSSDTGIKIIPFVTGKVNTIDGIPIASATVTVVGTPISTLTDNHGNFQITNINRDATIEISSVGFELLRLNLNGRRSILAVMKVKINLLDETVVIAYGQTTKRLNTGNITTIRSREIEQQPVQNPLLAMQGKVPGLVVTQNNGLPGGGVTVRIQGRNSLLNGNDPLYVVDGVPFFSQLVSTGVGGILGNSGGQTNGVISGSESPLSYLNPSDIESIEVLKDADATAIYGSRAANGAILITTKKGVQGKMRMQFDIQKGIGKIAQRVKMLNTEQYLEMRKEAFSNDGQVPSTTRDYDLLFWDSTKYTDWQDVLIGKTSKFTDLRATASGGSDNIQYLFGTSFHKETSVYPGSFFDKKTTIHFNLNTNSDNKRFRLDFSASYTNDNNQLPQFDLTANAVTLEPNAPNLYLEDGSLNWMLTNTGNSTWDNPLASIFYNTYSHKTNNLVSNAILRYKLVTGLELLSSFGYTKIETQDYNPRKLLSARPENRPFTQRIANFGNREIGSWIIEPQLKYNKNWGIGSLDVLLGTSLQKSLTKVLTLTGYGYSSDEIMEDVITASSVTIQGNTNETYKYNALFGRINYNIGNKYIINATARRDGSSRFGDKNQFHNFYSVAGAWIFSETKFIQSNLPLISFGKIKASFGTTGNDQIKNFMFLNLYSPPIFGAAGVPYQGVTELYSNGLTNPYLEWEETRKLSLGFEIGLINEKIYFQINYARNRSTNQLLPYALPNITGFNSITTNFPATIQNTNIEGSLSVNKIELGPVNWTNQINITIPKNKLLKFPDIENSSYASSLAIGQPIDVTKTYKLLGVDPSTGKYIFESKTGAPTSSPSGQTDANVFINTNPKFYGGYSSSFSFKNISLDILFQFVKQKGRNFIFSNGNTFPPGTFGAGFSNQPISVLNRWRQKDDVTQIQKYSTNRFDFITISQANSSDEGIVDASFVRLKNISLSWIFPQLLTRKLHASNVKLYLLSQNALTFTKYKGLDPETQSMVTLPPLQIWTLGLQMGL